MIYLDNASTSFPKPPETLDEIARYLSEYGVSFGRSKNILNDRVGELLAETKSRLASLMQIGDRDKIFFTQNATHALNLALKGFLNQGDHVLFCSLSHNSVIRPLHALYKQGKITFDWFDSFGDKGLLNLRKMIKKNTALICLNHVSNVNGGIVEIENICAFAKQNNIAVLIDATQSIGSLEFDFGSLDPMFIVGTGHKSLFGPTGVGFVYMNDPLRVATLMEGGSGYHSSSPYQPRTLPDLFEAGTGSITTIAGLLGGLKFNALSKRDNAISLGNILRAKIRTIEEIAPATFPRLLHLESIFSFNIRNSASQEISAILSEKYGILTRGGLHCAPMAHERLGTGPNGTVRVSFSAFNKIEHVNALIAALKEIIYRGEYTKVKL